MTNVAKTYFEMCKENNISKNDAAKLICDAVGLKFTASYANEWPNHPAKYRAIPPAVVREMQKRCAHYAAKKAGIKTSSEKAEKFAELLSPKINLSNKS